MASVFEEELDAGLRANPFVPFNVVLVGGLRYSVISPYMLIIRDSVLDHFPYGSDGRNLLRMNQLVAIETLDSPAGRRGQRKR